MNVSDVMSNCPEPLRPEDSVSVAAQRMKRNSVGMLPVKSTSGLIGMITERDIVVRVVASESPGPTPTVRDAMTVGIFYCYDFEPVDSVLRKLASSGKTHMMVLDEIRRPVGILSVANLIQRGVLERLAEALAVSEAN